MIKMFFKKFSFTILFLLFCYLNLVFCYSYRDQVEQNSNNNDELGNSQVRENYQKKNDFRAQENLDGSYNRQSQFNIENSNSNFRPPLTQRNPNFRSESPLLLRPNVLPMANDVAGDVPVRGETNKHRLLLPVSSKPVRSEDLPLSKNEKLSSKQIQNSFVLPLSRTRQSQNNFQNPKQHPESLEQLLNRKPAEKFLGPNFIQQSLANQNGENKFLSVYGKEEREINGTIELKKNGLLNAHLEETKDGRFQVMDRNHNKVGEVNLHRDVDKHFKLSQNNGVTNVELEKNTNAELNIEREINIGPKGRFSDSSNNHHLRVHVEQNQNSKAQVELFKAEENKPKIEEENYRYKRDTQEHNHLNSSEEGLTFFQKIGKSFNTLSEKAKKVFGETENQLCQTLINNSESYKTKLNQLMQNNTISFKDSDESNEEKSKFKSVFEKLKKNTYKLVNGITDKMILKLNNCSQILSDLKNKSISNQNELDLKTLKHPAIDQLKEENNLDKTSFNNSKINELNLNQATLNQVTLNQTTSNQTTLNQTTLKET